MKFSQNAFIEMYRNAMSSNSTVIIEFPELFRQFGLLLEAYDKRGEKIAELEEEVERAVYDAHTLHAGLDD